MRDNQQIFISLALSACLFFLPLLHCSTAFALNSSEAQEAFTKTELSKLFIDTENSDDCEFLLYDYKKEAFRYLKIRDAYKKRYEKLVGDDSVDILSTANSGRAVIKGHNLAPIKNTSTSPWCNILYLTFLYRNGNSGTGSAFMVSDKIAVTAAHCINENGTVPSALYAQAAYDNSHALANLTTARYTLFPSKWTSSGNGTASTDSNHDYGLIIFDANPIGIDDDSFFSYESISVKESLGLSINCAGYTQLESTTTTNLYLNERWGNISHDDPEPFGNCFRMNLSAISGMSGGPVFFMNDNKECVVVGINCKEKTFGEDTGFEAMNFACRITERLQLLIAWANANGPESCEPSQTWHKNDEVPYTIGIFQPSYLWINAH